jgi:hypothetical protein
MKNKIDWKEFSEFCSLRSKNKTHIRNLVNYAKKYGYLLELEPLKFALKFKEISKDRKTLKRHILQSLAALSRYLDLKYNTDENYKRFRELRIKAGISWSEEKIPQILRNEISKEQVLNILKNVKEERLKATSLLHLLTGLRTSEVFYLIKNFNKLKRSENERGLIIELSYIRKTKKVFVTFLHKNAIPLINKAYRNKRSYWKNLRKYGLRPYDFRRIFESLYSNLRSHEVDLLQGRLGTELTIHYTRDLSSLAKKVLNIQDGILKTVLK